MQKLWFCTHEKEKKIRKSKIEMLAWLAIERGWRGLYCPALIGAPNKMAILFFLYFILPKIFAPEPTPIFCTYMTWQWNLRFFFFNFLKKVFNTNIFYCTWVVLKARCKKCQSLMLDCIFNVLHPRHLSFLPACYGTLNKAAEQETANEL